MDAYAFIILGNVTEARINTMAKLTAEIKVNIKLTLWSAIKMRISGMYPKKIDELESQIEQSPSMVQDKNGDSYPKNRLVKFESIGDSCKRIPFLNKFFKDGYMRDHAESLDKIHEYIGGVKFKYITRENIDEVLVEAEKRGDL